MAKWHGISRRKATGGRLKRPNRYRGKRRTEISSEAQYAFVGDVDASKKYRKNAGSQTVRVTSCLLYTSPSPRDVEESRMPSSA